MLCTSPDARCDSKMVMASGPGVRGQYHCWIWTWLFSCEQDWGPCQSLRPLPQPVQPEKGVSVVTQKPPLSLHQWTFTPDRPNRSEDHEMRPKCTIERNDKLYFSFKPVTKTSFVLSSMSLQTVKSLLFALCFQLSGSQSTKVFVEA